MLGEDETGDFERAVGNLRERLDPCSKVLAGQDFWDSVQSNDYRKLNSVTKADNYPLPRIDDLPGKSKCFSTLDLASGFWQIKVYPNSQEKTAFSIPQGLFEFRVIPFGLMNAPSVFQRLMQQVVTDINPVDGPTFLTAYIDDLLVFSSSLAEHLNHLCTVLVKLREVGLKFNSGKCCFLCKEVQCLGHIVTCDGLKPNTKLIAAVQGYAPPRNIQDLGRFLRLPSRYRRFVPQFTKIAHPLHQLTCKEVDFQWSDACDCTFKQLKQCLVDAPVLAYPSFDKDFVLETDASVMGLGAVLTQIKSDGFFYNSNIDRRADEPTHSAS